MLHHIQKVMTCICLNIKDMKCPHIPGPCSLGFASDFIVPTRTANFLSRGCWNYPWEVEYEGRWTNFANREKKSGQRKVKQHVISHRTMQWQNQTKGKSWRSQLRAFYPPDDQDCHLILLPTPPTGRRKPAISFLSGQQGSSQTQPSPHYGMSLNGNDTTRNHGEDNRPVFKAFVLWGHEDPIIGFSRFLKTAVS